MSEYSCSYFSRNNLLKILLIFDVTGASYSADLLIVTLIRDGPKFHHHYKAFQDQIFYSCFTNINTNK